MTTARTPELPSTPCHVCGSATGVRPFLDLGMQPLGNAFIPATEVASERQYPLVMGVCGDCHLVQIVAPAPSHATNRVYRNYSYVPTGETLEQQYAHTAEEIVRLVEPRDGSRFLDVGSNDGLLLRSIRQRAPHAEVLGVEPSARISAIARKKGVPTLTGFFDAETAREVAARWGQVDVASATQVLQHVRDPVGLLRSLRELLAPDGVLVLEGRAYFPAVLEKVAFDTFYHELLYAFTLHSLERLLALAGFGPFHARRTDAYGGSLRVFSQRIDTGRRPVRESIAEVRAAEVAAGVTRFEAYRAFARSTETVRSQLRAAVARPTAGGRSLAGYGAPSTGTTLLNYCGLDHRVVRYIVDDNPLKQGLVTPGTHVPITPPSELRDHPVDYVLVIAWRLKDEIVARLGPIENGHLRGIIVPLPNPELVGPEPPAK
jgi:SAM-dependent methyltransferase